MNTPKLLTSILRTRRRHTSKGEKFFRSWLEAELLKRPCYFSPDLAGNIIACTDSNSRVAFSCHIDTCHGKYESDQFQTQDVIEDMGLLMLPPLELKGLSKRQRRMAMFDAPSCLGADDGAGIFIMLKMIDARVPGTYIFHVGEEVGGIGSGYIADHSAAWLKQFDVITAFDRAVIPGCAPEVIFEQGGRECASVTCASALADMLNSLDPSLGFVISDRGTFTDTRNYTAQVPECFNMGVFYWDQHGASECLDVEPLLRLTETLCELPWQDLPVVRTPVEPHRYMYNFTQPSEEDDITRLQAWKDWLEVQHSQESLQ